LPLSLRSLTLDVLGPDYLERCSALAAPGSGRELRLSLCGQGWFTPAFKSWSDAALATIASLDYTSKPGDVSLPRLTGCTHLNLCVRGTIGRGRPGEPQGATLAETMQRLQIKPPRWPPSLQSVHCDLSRVEWQGGEAAALAPLTTLPPHCRTSLLGLHIRHDGHARTVAAALAPLRGRLERVQVWAHDPVTILTSTVQHDVAADLVPCLDPATTALDLTFIIGRGG
jgi:hypothetical protein